MTNRKNKTAVIACVAAWLLGTAIAFSADHSAEVFSHSIQWESMAAGDVLVLQTTDRAYELRVIDGQRGIVDATFNTDQGQAKRIGKIRLLGATLGPQSGGLTLVQMGTIRVGMHLEWGVGDLQSENRVQTAVIRRILWKPSLHQ
ncbi:MAG: hypothetical protein VX738_03295 [Planctomycetota bacterium]|nr:hypothetical protein [Planctomycetota bacterium]